MAAVIPPPIYRNAKLAKKVNVGATKELVAGRRGNPDDDDAWFVTDWMDAARAQQALPFQHHSWPDMLEEMRRAADWIRRLLRLAAPIALAVLTRRSAYWKAPGQYADPWGAIRAKLGEPAPDRPYDRA